MDQGFPYDIYPNSNPNYNQIPPPPPPPLARDFAPSFPSFHPPPHLYSHSHPAMPPILPQRPPHRPSRSKHKPQSHQPTPNHHHHQQLAAHFQHHHEHQEHQPLHLAKQQTIHLQADRRAVLDALRTATATHAHLLAALERIRAENVGWQQSPNNNEDLLAEMDRLQDEMARAEREERECHRRWDELGQEIEETHLEIAFGESGGGGG